MVVDLNDLDAASWEGGDDAVDFLAGQGEVAVNRRPCSADGLEVDAGGQPSPAGKTWLPVVMTWLRATVNL